MLNRAPGKTGLYDPQYEHDACGIGFVAHIKGKKSHAIVDQGITILHNLAHRGAQGAEPNTGDGAGVLLQIPHRFFKKVTKGNFTLPKEGHYGVGMVYLPPDPSAQKKCKEMFEKIVVQEGQTVLGWRDIPTDNSSLGTTAKACEPVIKQIFIQRSGKIRNNLAFERKLYVIRKVAESLIRYAKEPFDGSHYFYISSLSSKTIVYKGMLMAVQVPLYFLDLTNPDVESAIALVHSRFSTNTFPSWERAHPYRYIIHNGEINTLRGNVNWMKARENLMTSYVFGEDLAKVRPIIQEDGSDSAMFDNLFEFLVLTGRSVAEAAMMMIPEPWEKHTTMNEERKAFYEFNSCLMEAWDGPASIGFSDGKSVGAILDRNGLRPSRYYVTKDDLVIMASEVGVLDVDPPEIKIKGRLQPGRMFLVDTEKGEIISDETLKKELASAHPYRKWIKERMITLADLPDIPVRSRPHEQDPPGAEALTQIQKAFGYTYEDLQLIIGETVTTKVDPVGSMGNDAPLAVLSNKPQLLYNYFRQLFAQVTNPPIDAIREELVTSSITMLGSEGNILHPKPDVCRRIKLMTPILRAPEFAKIKNLLTPHFKSVVLPLVFDHEKGGAALTEAMNTLFAQADAAIQSGIHILVISDRDISPKKAPIPALLATGGLHHHLIRSGTRTKVSIIVETGEPRAVHHFALLIGYGADAIFPYLTLDSIERMIADGSLMDISLEKAQETFLKATEKGVVKVMSKIGISTIQSYRGAQIFEAIGIDDSVIDRYFTGTASRIKGIDIEIIAEEVKRRFVEAFPARAVNALILDSGGDYNWRFGGEYHSNNPEVIHKIQHACRNNDYQAYKAYTKMVYNPDDHLSVLRDLFEFKGGKPISIEEVEPVETILKRFKTGGMSYGSISQETHEALAIAMNRIGGKSNSGEGGEDPARFTPLPNGDSKSSAIKQVASGRFGVTSEYLVNAKELQIKMAQGAKPGEGGQLPGRKVYPWIAKVRYATPGVGLISPPPHHDIYSIEDLAELIHDLKNANRSARINVKLVSTVGVGTIAAGVAKAHADVVLVSGAEGGTGASPRTSIKFAGIPWELGISETHQTLVLNNLRSRIIVETDGQMKTGRDIVIAALLGAEEFGLGTISLVVLGCIMMRICHLDTCPVGVATQNPKLREFFTGKPEHVVNFMRFVAQDVREIMAQLGFKTFNEMVGRTDKLQFNSKINHWKARKVDVTPILVQPDVPDDYGRYCQIAQDHGLDKSLDLTQLLLLCKQALLQGAPFRTTLPIQNVHRVVGTILGSEITKKYGFNGLPEDTIRLHFQGSAGQSFGAFVPRGVTLELEGDANDYLGKGLSGGKIIVYPPKGSTFEASKNIIIGNVAFYGASGGSAYIAGVAGERFCVRNSGVNAVIEGVGDHGCEYMTNGRVVVLGPTGRNFGAGMSGGTAFVLDEEGDFLIRCNTEMVKLVTFENDGEEKEIREMIATHVEYTKSKKGKYVLQNWEKLKSKFVKVLPLDYERMLKAYRSVLEQGFAGEEAIMAAFEANKNDLARVSGN